MRIATAFRSLALAAALSVIPAVSHAGIFVSVGIGAPPVLPVYAQPICPAPGYIWTPGYWAYNDEGGYYWVPGAWVLAPYTGALWTPGYWGWGNGGYFWHAGYWGRHIGFYGGVNYGFGYFGRGFEGGYWDHDRFRYNTAIMHVDNVRFHDVVYNRTVVNHYNTTRVSFNGGHGGIAMRPNGDEQRWSREQHTPPLGAQHQNEMRASQNHAQFANVNHGQPQNFARTQPATFNRNMSANNRPTNTFNRGAANNSRPMMNNNASRPATFNNAQRTATNNPGFNRGPQQTYRPQAQQQYRAAPQQSHQASQQSRPQESHGGGHEGGHGGHGR
ncbi:MAG: YXWGXW repeat-containing protein [Acidobacteriaceae bacterium]